MKQEEEIRASKARLEVERAVREERERKAEEKRKARNRKIAMISIPLAIVAVAMLLLVTQIVIPKNNYEKAMDLLERKQYEQAAAVFEELSEYSNSESMKKKACTCTGKRWLIRETLMKRWQS